MTTYLIDFENVREDGLNGLYDLPSTDRVVIFYTAENEKISLKWFSISKANMSAIKVAPGSQSLDKHLLSWLGYLLGDDCDPNSCYVIVSRDNGYANIASFWNERLGSGRVVVRNRINEEKPVKAEKPEAPKKPEIKEEAKPKAEAEAFDTAALSEKVKGIILSNGVKDGSRIRIQMSSVCDALINDEDFKAVKGRGNFRASSFVRSLSKEFSVFHRGPNVWVAVEAPKAEAHKQEAPVSPVEAKLLEMGLEAEDVSEVVSIAQQLKAEGANVKQRLYRECLRKFQRARGTEVYNSIKNII